MNFIAWFIGGIGLSLSALSIAQVYTWKDESGKVHYSDQRRADNAEATQIDIGAMPPPILVNALAPVSFSKNAAPLVLDGFYYAQTVSVSEKELITYYFGGDCVSPTSQDFNQLRTTYPNVLREEKNLMADVFRAFRLQGYGNLYRSGHYSTPDLSAVNAVTLSGEIVDLSINACRSQLMSGARTGDLENSSVGQFDLLNAWLQVRWRVSLAGESTPLFEIETEGMAATRLQERLGLTSAVRVAFEMAVNNLIAREDFRQSVTFPGDRNAYDVTTKEPRHVDDEPLAVNPLDTERKLYERALLQSSFSQALQRLSLLKIGVAEYFHIQGSMPLTIDDLGYNAKAISANRYIDSVKMRAPGVIYAELSEEHFPGSHFIELAPEVEEGFSYIQWACLTSMPKYIAPGVCHQP
ncbi:DUF4124 domain-containing protein [Gilvimarinus sp. SDUM040013]|uniref:DUF4124 domain-containing protein n=1 Tax=Gilvimarinus gilvus TaxID=3058038 RepID=A0ABU4RYA0_9GAMM|nr:DUF4124 domain-containing protein [Gilvimarinus sp. SDUM040013]MDO3387370.1 DUF4124 domain-containing protein [Gilvimarinus sp. SDUM040013]MDX6849847.1 DUF4124 domain-containing protein [Gilvimarinus sp. SDUM040013]